MWAVMIERYDSTKLELPLADLHRTCIPEASREEEHGEVSAASHSADQRLNVNYGSRIQTAPHQLLGAICRARSV